MREVHARRSPEEKKRLAEMYGRLALGNKSRTGQKASPEERAKLSKARIGNKNAVSNKNAAGKWAPNDPRRKAISDLMKGKKTRLGAKLTEQQRSNISAGRKGKAIGNQNWRKRKSVIAQHKELENGPENSGLIGPDAEQSVLITG